MPRNATQNYILQHFYLEMTPDTKKITNTCEKINTLQPYLSWKMYFNLALTNNVNSYFCIAVFRQHFLPCCIVLAIFIHLNFFGGKSASLMQIVKIICRKNRDYVAKFICLYKV